MDGLDLTANLLTIIKARGWDAAFAEDVLYRVPQSDHNRSHARLYDEPLFSLRQLLQDTKHCMSTLSKITEQLGRKMRRLERKTMPLVLEDGIRRLPDELLANVFELGHLSTDGLIPESRHYRDLHRGYALRVSHVSRRFREVSLKLPILWTRLSVSYPASTIEAFISRSGQCDLEIDAFPPQFTSMTMISNFKKKLKKLGTYSHRWSHLSIYDSETEGVLRKLGFTNFPRLRELYHSCRLESDMWQMPSLTRIGCSSWHFGPGVSFLAQLTTFEISFDRMETVDTDDLAQAIQSMSNLRNLSVELLDCRNTRQTERSGHDHKAHSVHIENLTINMGEHADYGIARELYDGLSFLAPTTVEISLDYDIEGGHYNYLVDSEGNFFPFASVITLCIGAEMDFMNLFSAIGESCDIVHTIHFVATSFTTYKTRSDCTPVPSIRHLRFAYSDSLNEEALKCIVKHPMFAQVEDFEILFCSRISEDFLIDLQDEVGDKLKWSS